VIETEITDAQKEAHDMKKIEKCKIINRSTRVLPDRRLAPERCAGDPPAAPSSGPLHLDAAFGMA
jgi:hypothetical protein